VIGRVAAWFTDEDSAITIPVGFIVLYTLWVLLTSIVSGIVYPIVLALLDRDHPDDFNDSGLSFHVGNALIDLTPLLIYGVAFILLAVIVYVLATRIRQMDRDADDETRECPECKSDILADARRCAFCSAPVDPLGAAQDGAGV
jgi:large conductance mechanosensitive channel